MIPWIVVGALVLIIILSMTHGLAYRSGRRSGIAFQKAHSDETIDNIHKMAGTLGNGKVLPKPDPAHAGNH